MNDDLRELYGDLIRDHGNKPRHYHVLPDANRSAEGNNPFCGDHFTVYLKLEGDVIRDISFQGHGCEISTASASIMADELKGKTITDARHLFTRYQDLVKTGKMDEDAMGKLCAFSGVFRFPMRVKCATLPWHAMLAGLDGQMKVSTDAL